jgi:hypothetical protein
MLTVTKFDDPGGADRTLLALRDMYERQAIDMPGGGVVVSWPQGLERRSALSHSGTRR